MRSLALVAVLLLAAACGSSDTVDGGGPDGGISAADASNGAPDSGLPQTACGARTCAPGEYCLVTPVGPCMPADGGTCGAGLEACQKSGIAGCTLLGTRACRTLPPGCDRCSCIISAPGTCAGASCSARDGLRAECPFP